MTEPEGKTGKCLYIHIGTGKTGTTAIQKFCDINQPKLQEAYGFSYYRSHEYSKNFTKSTDKTNEKLNELKSAITSSELSTHLISSEYFPGDNLEQIKHIKELFSDVCDIKIIAYLRRQDEFIWSWYCQRVKSTHILQDLERLTQALYRAKNILNYEKFLEPWQLQFGTENILVNVYPPKDDLILNFFNNFNIKLNLTEFTRLPLQNRSLTAEQIIFIKMMFILEADILKNNTFAQSMIQRPFNIEFNYTKSLISPARRKEILSDFEEYNNNVAKKYLNRDELFVDLPIKDEDTWVYPNIIKSGYYETAKKYITENAKKYSVLNQLI